MKAIVYHGYDRDHIAPVVDRIPAGFQVWNIGKHAPAGYVLVARVSHYNVDMATLCAIALNDQEKSIIDRACSYGANNLINTRRKLQQYKTNKRAIMCIAAALPVFEKYCR